MSHAPSPSKASVPAPMREANTVVAPITKVAPFDTPSAPKEPAVAEASTVPESTEVLMTVREPRSASTVSERLFPSPTSKTSSRPVSGTSTTSSASGSSGLTSIEIGWEASVGNSSSESFVDALERVTDSALRVSTTEPSAQVTFSSCHSVGSENIEAGIFVASPVHGKTICVPSSAEGVRATVPATAASAGRFVPSFTVPAFCERSSAPSPVSAPLSVRVAVEGTMRGSVASNCNASETVTVVVTSSAAPEKVLRLPDVPVQFPESLTVPPVKESSAG